MKKFLAILIAVVLTASLAAAIAIAAYEIPGDDGSINVAFMDTDLIMPDGTIEENEWPDGITLDGNNLVSWFAGAYTDTITLYTAWNENGFYIAAGPYPCIPASSFRKYSTGTGPFPSPKG